MKTLTNILFRTLIILSIIFEVNKSSAQLKVMSLLVDNQVNPESIGNYYPHFSWQILSNRKNVIQNAYEIIVTKDKKIIWKSGKINIDSSVNVAYKGPYLESGLKYNWTVQIWDNYGNNAKSAVSWFRMGLMRPNDWKAKWIGIGYEEDKQMRPSPMFEKSFTANKQIKDAVLYITCHGIYFAEINGVKVGDEFFTPGWTTYNKRLQYQAYDVTKLLKKKENSLRVTLGSGWYRGNIGFWEQKDIYGDKLALLSQLVITYTDGSQESVLSNNSWKCTESKIRFAEFYQGEIIDHSKELRPWQVVKELNYDYGNLISTINEPVRKQETFKPIKIIKTPDGSIVADFGQNLAGFTRLKIKGNKGDIISLQHAETLDKSGNFYTKNLRSASQEDIFILNGENEEVFEPHFTSHGFRYVKIVGIKGINPEDIRAEQLEAIALYSDMPKIGSFQCSDTLLNQLQHNIVWSQNSNFIDVPTDCPQRDERLGWTGDAQIFSRTASYNRQVDKFFSKWMKDLAADQFANGAVPFVIPDIFSPIDKNSRNGAAGWSDAVTIIPWNMYLVYGDKQLLADMYPHMKAWVDYITTNSKDGLWRKNFQFGDWLSYRSGYNEVDRSALTDIYLVAQSYYACSTSILIDAARVLGKTEDLIKYDSILNNVKTAFCREYVTPNGRILSNTQTSYVLALQFNLLPDSLRNVAAKMLADNIASYDYHLTTGFLGVSYLPHVLSRFGYTDIAYKLLLQKTYPSWLYPVKMGATTIWERWDGIKPDSTFQIPDMNSFNHYSYGAIGDWMYRVIAGIDTDSTSPGYKKIKIIPHPGGNLKFVTASLQTAYGTVQINWEIEDNRFKMAVQIPPNTTAEVYVPENDLIHYKKVSIGSGSYNFESN